MKRVNYFEKFNMAEHLNDALTRGKFSYDMNDRRDLLDAFETNSGPWLDVYRFRLCAKYDRIPLTPDQCEKYRARVYRLIADNDSNERGLYKRTRLTLTQFKYVMDYFPEIRKMYHDKQLRLHGLVYDGFTTVGFYNLASHMRKACKANITASQLREAYENHEPVLGHYIRRYVDESNDGSN